MNKPNNQQRLDLEIQKKILDALNRMVITLNQSSSNLVNWGDITGTLSDQTDLQTALNAKENTITTLSVAKGGTNSGTALSNNRVMKSSAGAIVEAAAITANRALISDSNGIPVHSATTNTQLGYLQGISSPSTGDIFYFDGTNIVKLAAGTAKQQLEANGAAAPIWIRRERIVYNTTPQSVTSASETDITALTATVEANKNYLIEVSCATECSGTSGILFGHKFPTGSTFKLTHSGRTSSATATMNLGNVYTANTGLINNAVNTAASATGSYVAHCFLSTTNSGSYQLTFASVSGVQTSTIREYSHVKITEV